MSSDDESEEYLFKIVIIGDSAVGKSNLLSRYARNEFNMHTKSTIGVEFHTQSIDMDSKEVKAQIWDTAGQERFRAVTSAYYRGAVGALIVYDISRSSTFDSVWLDELNTHCGTTVAIMLVRNKCDLGNIRAVSTEEGRRLAEEHGMFFMETSAKETTNVKSAFENVIKDICNNVSRKVLNSDTYKAELSVKRVGSASSITRTNRSKTRSRIRVAPADHSHDGRALPRFLIQNQSLIDTGGEFSQCSPCWDEWLKGSYFQMCIHYIYSKKTQHFSIIPVRNTAG